MRYKKVTNSNSKKCRDERLRLKYSLDVSSEEHTQIKDNESAISVVEDNLELCRDKDIIIPKIEELQGVSINLKKNK